MKMGVFDVEGPLEVGEGQGGALSGVKSKVRKMKRFGCLGALKKSPVVEKLFFWRSVSRPIDWDRFQPPNSTAGSVYEHS